MVSVYEVTSLQTMLMSKVSPFQLKLGLNECHFGLPQLWTVIHLTLSMCIFTSRLLVLRMHIDKVYWITAHNYGKPKWHSFTAEKGTFWASTLSHKMCPRKQTTELNLLILVSFFLRRRCLIHWYQLLRPHIMGSMPFHFHWSTLYNAPAACEVFF